MRPRWENCCHDDCDRILPIESSAAVIDIKKLDADGNWKTMFNTTKTSVQARVEQDGRGDDDDVIQLLICGGSRRSASGALAQHLVSCIADFGPHYIAKY